MSFCRRIFHVNPEHVIFSTRFAKYSSFLTALMWFVPVQLEIIIMRSPSNRVVVRNNRINLYTNSFTEDIPLFSGSYYLGGVPENKMPAK